jgi:hypothetical protein
VQSLLLLSDQRDNAIEGSGNERSDDLRLLCCSTPASPRGRDNLGLSNKLHLIEHGLHGFEHMLSAGCPV